MADLSQDTIQSLQESREDLIILAESDLPVSGYADSLLSLIEEDRSDSTNEPTELTTNEAEPSQIDSNNDPRNILAY